MSWHRTDAEGPTPMVVQVVGEIDLATAPALAVELQLRLLSADTAAKVVVDLGAVTFIDMRGLAALDGARDTALAAGVPFAITNRPRCLLRLLHALMPVR